jgi:T5SS/PEP-CTERM-associated repeat protein
LSSSETFSWIGAASTDWNTPANWVDITTGQTPAATVPGELDTAIVATSSSAATNIVLTGDAIISALTAVGTGSSDLISVLGSLSTGTLVTEDLTNFNIGPEATISTDTLIASGGITLAGSLSELHVNSTIDLEGALDVTNGASLTGSLTGSVTVGQWGNGTLTVQNGAHVDEGDLTVAAAHGSSGSVSISNYGTFTPLSMTIGALGSGQLSVTNGGFIIGSALTVAAGAGSSGKVLISDGRVEVGPIIAGVAGSGNITIQNGGGLIGNGLSIAMFTGSTGDVTVSDSATLILYGTIDVGQGGAGTFTVQSGAFAYTQDLGVNASIGVLSTAVTGLLSLASNGYMVDIGNLAVGQGATVSVDSTSGLDVGGSFNYVNGAINLENGHTLIGDGLIAAALVNNGTIDATNTSAGSFASDGKLEITGPIDGTGVITIAVGTTLQADGTIGAGQAIAFAAEGPATLILGALADNTAGTITDFVAGDTIVVDTPTAVTFNQTGSVISVQSNGSTLARLTFASATLAQVAAGTPGALVGQVACFTAGTRLATLARSVAVETLVPGDLVLTADGRAEPVVWVGRRSVDCRRHPRPSQVQPIRARANAFGPGMPERDLYLSPDHAVFVEDVLIPVKYLVNGSSITQIDAALVTYYHIELPQHDVVLADGLPVESYLETGGRSDFENSGNFMRLHPSFGMEEARLSAVWEGLAYAPLVVTGSILDRVRDRLAARAVLLSFETALDASLPSSAVVNKK